MASVNHAAAALLAASAAIAAIARNCCPMGRMWPAYRTQLSVSATVGGTESNSVGGRDAADRATVAPMGSRAQTIPLEEYFEGSDPRARELYDAAAAAVLSVGDAEVRVTSSQIAFRRRRSFAWTWLPGQFLAGGVAPLVLSIDLDRYDTSPRWKEVAEPTLNHFMHHLELHSADDIDDGVLDCLREAWNLAG
jgi:hypothetical protein